MHLCMICLNSLALKFEASWICPRSMLEVSWGRLGRLVGRMVAANSLGALSELKLDLFESVLSSWERLEVWERLGRWEILKRLQASWKLIEAAS